MIKSKFKDLLPQFDAILLDSYGVLKNHQGLIPDVGKVLDRIRDLGLPYRILTNDASRGPEEQRISFEAMGLSGIKTEEIITSGMMARNFLIQKITKGAVVYLGTEKAAQHIIQAKLHTIPVSEVDLDKLDEVAAMVFLDDEGFDWNTDINKTLNILRKVNIPVVVANSDQIYPSTKHDVSIATGGIAKLVEATLNRKFIHFGKPDSQMFMYASEQILKEAKIKRQNMLMVGDTLHTDILGGNKFGLKTALVLSGNTRRENMEILIQSTGIIPDYICESIVD